MRVSRVAVWKSLVRRYLWSAKRTPAPSDGRMACPKTSRCSARVSTLQTRANGPRKASLVVACGHAVAAGLERLVRVAHDVCGAGEVEHLDVVEVVAEGGDVGRGPSAALHPAARVVPFEQPAALTSTSEKSRPTYSVTATEN